MIVSQSHAGQIYNVSKIAFGKDIKIVPAAGAGNSVNIIILILLFNITYSILYYLHLNCFQVSYSKSEYQKKLYVTFSFREIE